MQKISIIPKLAFDKLKFNKSCYLIGEEYFGLQLENQIFPRHAVFIKTYSQLYDIIQSTKSNVDFNKILNVPILVQICLLYPII